MNQFAMQGQMTALTIESLKKALFDGGELVTSGMDTFNDIGYDWADEGNLGRQRPFESNEGLQWDGTKEAQGQLWGGCIESMVVQCTVGAYLPETTWMKGKILFLESSENIPQSWVIRYLIIGLGERGWFDQVAGVMVGRPKAWDFSQQNNIKQKMRYREQQRETIKSAIRDYNPDIPIVQNVDFGHTDPQIVLPVGRIAKLAPKDNTITLDYSL